MELGHNVGYNTVGVTNDLHLQKMCVPMITATLSFMQCILTARKLYVTCIVEVPKCKEMQRCKNFWHGKKCHHHSKYIHTSGKYKFLHFYYASSLPE